MNIGGLVLGIINIAIVAAVLILLGLLVVWLLKAFSQPDVGPEIRKFYLLFVLLVCLYMLVALFLGLPSLRVIGGATAPQPSQVPPITATIPEPTTKVVR